MNITPARKRYFFFDKLIAFLGAFLLVGCTTFLKAQAIQTLLNPSNLFINNKLESIDPEGMLYFKPSSDLGAGDLFIMHKQYTGLGADDAMILVSSEADPEGYVHNQYQQYHKNLKVEGGEMFEHLKNCQLLALNGRLIEGLSINTQPAYNEQQALAIAMNIIGATQYAWEDSDMEEDLQEMTGDPNATYYPAGKLMLAYEPNSSLNASNFKLSWLFEIVSVQPASLKTVYVNAQNGTVLKIFDNADFNGPCTTLYDGSQTLDTKWVGGLFHGHHHLVGDDNGKNVETRKNGTAGLNWKDKDHIFDLDDVWAADRMAEAQAHWGVSRTWDFFKDSYARVSMDNENCSVKVVAVSSSTSLRNLAGHINIKGQHFIEFGVSTGLSGPAGTNVSSLDIAGHEFTHGVIEHEANFAKGFGQSSSLAESFCDIFAVMVERLARNGSFNFTIGEDVGGSVFRSLENPAASATPGASTYLTDPLWCSAPSATCSPHGNGGVQNRWFYLLSVGGTQNGVNVQGIGIDKAAKIAYYNLCHYLGSTATFPASRMGAIAAAKFLFGPCSNEVIQTTNAWAAVGVGTTFSSICVTIEGITAICTENSSGSYAYNAAGLPGANFTWSYPTDWTAYPSGSENSQLIVTNIPAYSNYPTTKTISATSSLGGTASIEIELYDNCEFWGDCEGEDRSNIYKIFKKSDGVMLSPNPTKGKIRVLANGEKIQKVSVYSLTGSIIAEEQRPTGNEVILDISQVPSGTYFVSIHLESGLLVKRIIKNE